MDRPSITPEKPDFREFSLIVEILISWFVHDPRCSCIDEALAPVDAICEVFPVLLFETHILSHLSTFAASAALLAARLMWM